LRKLVILGLVGLALISCSHEPRGDVGGPIQGLAHTSSPKAPDIPADAPLVVFLGDSISAGLHLPESDAFPAVAQRDLARSGHPFRLVNAGVSGDTSAGGLRRVDWVLKQKPDVLVLELGANDGLRGEPVEGIEQNLRGIIQRTREAGVKVLLLGMRLPTNYSDYAPEFDSIYPRIAQDMNVPFVPYFMEKVGGVPELTLGDGLHPTAAGHEILAANVEPKLIEVVDSVRPR
jgi:acyl-CoA thioesterase-1